MKSQSDQPVPQLAPAMVENKETEKRKKRDMDAGLIRIANDGKATTTKAVKKGGKQ